MARMIVLYTTPPDLAAFDRHYTEVHIPLVHKMPGLKKFELSQGAIATPFGPSSFHLIATLHFADPAAMHAAMGSPEGRAAGADAQSFIQPADQLLLFDTREA